MGADDNVLTADGAYSLAEHLAATRSRRQPIFFIALFGAAAVHAALILGMIGSPPRYIGDPDGSSRVINVELIDEAELQNSAPSTSGSDNAPSAAATIAPRPQPEVPRLSEPDLSQQTAERPSLETQRPMVPSPQDTAEERQVTEIVPKFELNPPAQLDLRVPFTATTSGAQGGSSGATRPPGITRSGENDKFGRDVIRSLRKTMPPPTGIKGRVTIRIFLDEQGNISKAELVQSGGNPELDRSVLFSAQQATFPYPPNGATVADRTFRVTYVYR